MSSDTPISLVLASGSPRRRQLIALTGWAFRVQPADVDETPLAGEEARPYVLRLALAKAQAAANGGVGAGEVIVAADTTVALDEHILGKPQDAAEAEDMLRRLRGRSHQVHTALAVLYPHANRLVSDVCSVSVPMRNYTDGEILAYVASGDPLDKAGAYAIQHAGFHPVEDLHGCYAGVVGLPVCHLDGLLRRVGLARRADVPPACQAALVYECPVYREFFAEL